MPGHCPTTGGGVTWLRTIAYFLILRVGGWFGGKGGIGDGKGVDHGQRKKGGDRQVEGYLGVDTGQLDHIGDEVEAKVVVVDNAAGKMGINRREGGAAQNAIEHGKFHKLFPTKPELPEIGVAHTQADKANVGGGKEHFTRQQQTPIGAQKGLEVAPLPDRRGGPKERQGKHR